LLIRMRIAAPPINQLANQLSENGNIILTKTSFASGIDIPG
jgi:hypothetical protein